MSIRKSSNLVIHDSKFDIQKVLKETGFFLDPRAEPLDSPLSVLSYLLNFGLLNEDNSKMDEFDQLTLFYINQKDFPIWVKRIAKEYGLLNDLYCLCPIKQRDCLFFVYACQVLRINITLYFLKGKEIDYIKLNEVDEYTCNLLIHDGYYHAMSRKDPRRSAKKYEKYETYSKLANRVLINNHENFDNKTKMDRNQSSKYIYNTSTSIDEYRNLKNPNFRNILPNYKNLSGQKERLKTNSSSGFVNYMQLSAIYNLRTSQGHTDPQAKMQSIASSKLEQSLNLKLADTEKSEDTKKSKKIHDKDKNQTNESAKDESDFSRALSYITAYQEMLKKTIRSKANGKVCELKAYGVSKEYFEGSLKFYTEKSKFGFIKVNNGQEIFIHKDNLVKSRIDPTMFEICSQFFEIILKFQTLAYKGNRDPTVKAVNIEIINFIPKDIKLK